MPRHRSFRIIPALRDWLQWCLDEAPPVITESARRRAGEILKEHMTKAPHDTDWALLGASLALDLSVPRETRIMLQSASDRASFWAAVVRALAVVDSRDDLSTLTSIMGTPSAAPLQQQWLADLASEVPGADRTPTPSHFDASQPINPCTPPMPTLADTPILVSFPAPDAPAVCSVLRQVLGSDAGLSASPSSLRKGFHFGTVPAAAWYRLSSGLTRVDLVTPSGSRFYVTTQKSDGTPVGHSPDPAAKKQRIEAPPNLPTPHSDSRPPTGPYPTTQSSVVNYPPIANVPYFAAGSASTPPLPPPFPSPPGFAATPAWLPFPPIINAPYPSCNVWPSSPLLLPPPPPPAPGKRPPSPSSAPPTRPQPAPTRDSPPRDARNSTRPRDQRPVRPSYVRDAPGGRRGRY